MLLKIVLPLVWIKIKSNNFKNLQPKQVRHAHIHKQYNFKTLLFSRINYHVGSNLNLETKLCKRHQLKALKMSQINDKSYCLSSPKAKTARGPLSARGAPRRPGRNLGLAGNLARARLPPGPNPARLPPIALGRRIRSDGRPASSADQNPSAASCSPKP